MSTKNKQSSINVQGTAISIISHSDEDYISLTDKSVQGCMLLSRLDDLRIMRLSRLSGDLLGVTEPEPLTGRTKSNTLKIKAGNTGFFVPEILASVAVYCDFLFSTVT